jgi:16S rRNA processing protein RimM
VAGHNPSSRVLLGRIAGAHGIRGEVLIRSFTSAPEDIGAYGALSTEDGSRAFEIASARATPKGVVARLQGIVDRNAAEALKGTDLYVARDRLPPPSNDEFYYADLIGMTAVGPDGATLGEIVAVQNFGAGDLLEIRPAGGGRTELLPFTDDVVPEVDIAARRVTVVPPKSDDA